MDVHTPDGVRLHVEEDGPVDAPPLVIVHGITASAHEFAWLVGRLDDRFRVLRPDFRGHGHSDRCDRYEAPDCVTDLTAVLERVGPALVMGHSLGGIATLAVAQARPELVRAALVIDPAFRGADPDEELGGLSQIFEPMFAAMPRIKARGITVETFGRHLLAAPTPYGRPAGEVYEPGTTETWARSQLLLDVEVLRPLVDDDVEEVPIPFDLDAPIDVPVVVLAADPDGPDTIARPEHRARLEAAGSPDLTWVAVEGAGHSFPDEREHRATFLRWLDEFLARHA